MAIGRTIIAGAGPGGLTLARSLQLAGRDFVLLERRLPGESAADVGRHGSRAQIALWDEDNVEYLEPLGMRSREYPMPPMNDVHMGAIGRFERDFRSLVLDAAGPGDDVRFGARVTSVRQRPEGGVEVGVGGTRDAPAEWIQGDELANFTGGRIGDEAVHGMARREWSGAIKFASARWKPQPIAEDGIDSERLRGFHNRTDGAYLVMPMYADRPEPRAWQLKFRLAARMAGVRGAMEGQFQLFTVTQSGATRARAGDVLGGGDTVARKYFGSASGANTAIRDARDMAEAIAAAAADPARREPLMAGYGEAALRRNLEALHQASMQGPDVLGGHPDFDFVTRSWKQDP